MSAPYAVVDEHTFTTPAGPVTVRLFGDGTVRVAGCSVRPWGGCLVLTPNDDRSQP